MSLVPNARRRTLGAAAVLAGSVLAACTSILGIEPPPAGAGPVTSFDAGMGGAAATCPSLDGGDGYDYLPFEATSASWQVVPLASLGSSTESYFGGCFAKDAYYFGTQLGKVARVPVSDAGELQTEQIVDTSAASNGFAGTCFDGNYVYFTPSVGGSIGRFDAQPTAPFAADAGQWFGLDAGAPGVHFFGCAVGPGGETLYLAPGTSPTLEASGVVARYSITGSFTSASAWSTFDLGTLSSEARGFAGAVATENSVTLVPEQNNAFDAGVNHGHSGTVARFNGTSKLDTAGSWSTFDTTAVSGDATDFVGGAFDGRYVYLVPRSATAIATRYDSSKVGSPNNEPLSSLSLWQHYDLTRVAPPPTSGAGGYQGAGFDGRYVYFAPDGSGPLVVVRYDTRADFEADCAWSTVDLTTIPGVDASALAGGFAGVIFDGKYVSFVPSKGNVSLVRFQACTKCQPPSFPYLGGSFL